MIAKFSIVAALLGAPIAGARCICDDDPVEKCAIKLQEAYATEKSDGRVLDLQRALSISDLNGKAIQELTELANRGSNSAKFILAEYFIGKFNPRIKNSQLANEYYSTVEGRFRYRAEISMILIRDESGQDPIGRKRKFQELKSCLLNEFQAFKFWANSMTPSYIDSIYEWNTTYQMVQQHENEMAPVNSPER